jgi:hypothetical protein
VVRFNKYAAYRKLPADLTNRVLSYYEYQWQLLRGVDENKVCVFASCCLYLNVFETVSEVSNFLCCLLHVSDIVGTPRKSVPASAPPGRA